MFLVETPDWHKNVASNLARLEIQPYAKLFDGRDRLTIFDCGANRGLWTRGAIETFSRANIEAHLFEPSSANCAFIRDRSAQGYLYTDEQFRSITVNQVAVGAEKGEMTLYSDWDGSWLGSLVNRPDIATSKTEAVSVITLDGYAEQKGVSAIDILKLDIEGWEFQALNGAATLLSRNAIQTILFEFSHANVFSRTFFYDFWLLLTKHGFSVYSLERGPTLIPVTTYAGKWERFNGTFLYFASHQSVPAPLYPGDKRSPENFRAFRFMLDSARRILRGRFRTGRRRQG